MSSCFISDLHLRADQPQVAAGFFHFLAQLNDAEALYILGDFFEYWIGDDYSDLFVDHIKNQLRQATARFPIFFMHGNRDFLIGERFCSETGITLLHDPQLIDLYGRPVLLMHGDSLCTLDYDYIQARTYLRDPQWQANVLAKSIPERLAMAREARAKSQATAPEKITQNDIMDVTPQAVEEAFMKADVSLLIHGHTHRPQCHWHRFNNRIAQRIVLGDWGQTGWMVKADEKHAKLIEFPLF